MPEIILVFKDRKVPGDLGTAVTYQNQSSKPVTITSITGTVLEIPAHFKLGLLTFIPEKRTEELWLCFREFKTCGMEVFTVESLLNAGLKPVGR